MLLQVLGKLSKHAKYCLLYDFVLVHITIFILVQKQTLYQLGNGFGFIFSHIIWLVKYDLSNIHNKP